MALTDSALKALKPRAKAYKVADEKGLYVQVTPAGGKLWKLKFRNKVGAEKKLSLGAYPEISLREARELRDVARSNLAKGLDPAEQKQRDKRAALISAANSFEAVAKAYIAKNRRDGLAEATVRKREWFLDIVRKRLPFAKRRASEELNRAYAHVSEVSFAAAANGLMDRLTQMGFDERSAREAILEMPPTFELEGGEIAPLYRAPEPVTLTLQERPDVSGWSPAAQDAVRMAEAEGGKVLAVIAPDAPDEVKREIATAMEPLAPGAVEAVERYIVQSEAAKCPAARGVPFEVPQLQIMVQGELDLAYPESFIDLAGWDLLSHGADLPSFNYVEQAESYEFDIEGDKLVYGHLSANLELALDDSTDWDEGALARFLDRSTRQLHTGQEVYLEYCRRVVVNLTEQRRMPLAALVRGKYALRRAVIARVAELRTKTAARGLQLFLDGTGAPTAPSTALHRFVPNAYVARRPYVPGYRFTKHYYSTIDDLKASGEELECAKVIDRLDEVKHWVRNAPHPFNAYRLPTSTDFFYPDFVAELADGRQLVVEYKGEAYKTNDDSKEKNNVGLKAEEASGGKLLFLMAVLKDDLGRDVRAQILAKIGGGS